MTLLRSVAWSRPYDGPIMRFITLRSAGSVVIFVAALSFVPGCVSIQLWPRPLTTPGDEDRPWPKPDRPGNLDLEQVRESLLTLHNRARAEKKSPRLEVSRTLQEAAQAHAEEMASRARMTHRGADGSDVVDRIQTLGYRYRRCGENIAYGHYTPEAVMRGWLTSLPHRKNIQGGFSQAGFGYAIGKDGTPYWCVTFGLPARR